MASSPPSTSKTLKNGMKSLLKSGEFSDFTIVCEDKEFKVHKNIICAQSEYFRKAVTGGFKEAKEGRLDLKEIDSDIVKAILEYLYTERCLPPGSFTTNYRPLYFYARLALAAEMLMLQQLQREATDQLQHQFLANYNNLFDAKKAISTVYNLTSAGSPMRELVLSLVSDYQDELFNQDQAASKDFLQFIESTPEFAAELVMMFQGMVRQSKIETKGLYMYCTNCNSRVLLKEATCLACYGFPMI